MPILIQRAIDGSRRRRHDEAALSVAEVDELEDVGVGLEQHILSDDADVGGAVGDVRRHVARTGEHELDVRGRQHEPAPAVGERVGRESGGLERDPRVGQQGPLGERDP